MAVPSDTDVTVVTLDGHVHAPETPLLYADDLAALRGDGVFETLLVRDGAACLLEAHLRRLVRSAELMDLPAPEPAAWRGAIELALRQRRHRSGEAVLRLIYSRGRENGSGPTGYVMITALPERIAATRRDGVAAVTLDRGWSAHEEDGAAMPWLLAGAKTLSYAVNMAALRYAATRGADEVVFVSSDGYVLEGPRSTVVITPDGRELLTPPLSQRILRGTTQQALFQTATARGYRCEYQPLRPADLVGAQGVWLVSSVALATRVHTLDGRALPQTPLAGEFRELIDAAIGVDSASPA